MPGRAFTALSVPNFRRFYAGQAISLSGTWMQRTAQTWLVFTLTGSSTVLGLVVAAQTLPILLFGPYGGVLADRIEKRRLMLLLQIGMGVQAALLAVLTLTGAVRVWEIAALAATLGIATAFESPARQAFMLEMVGTEELRNAISLNGVLTNVARTVGPALAGLLIAAAGDGVCFLVNAGSFLPVIASLATLDRRALTPTPAMRRARGQLRDGLRHASSSPQLAVPLIMMAFVGTLTFEFRVTLPVLARALGHGAAGYGFMMASMGVGAVIGGLVVAARGGIGLRALTLAAAAFGTSVLMAAVAPGLPAAVGALVLAGGASVWFTATGNSTLQLNAAPEMRGRVVSLWFVGFQGSTAVGGPLIGWIVADAGARAGLAVGGGASLAVAGLGLWHRSRARRW